MNDIFLTGYDEALEEIVALKAEIERKDEAMNRALNQAKYGEIGLAFYIIEQALSKEE